MKTAISPRGQRNTSDQGQKNGSTSFGITRELRTRLAENDANCTSGHRTDAMLMRSSNDAKVHAVATETQPGTDNQSMQ